MSCGEAKRGLSDGVSDGVSLFMSERAAVVFRHVANLKPVFLVENPGKLNG